MTLDPFYPIVDTSAWLDRLLPLGVKLVQLRMKDRHGNSPDEATRRREIIRARDLCEAHSCQLIVNDFWEIAIDEKCDFIHLGQEDLNDADLSAIRRAGLKLGVSTHSDEELERGLSVDPDYVALGPIYPTILKEMKWDPQGLEKIPLWKKRIGKVPLCAIGGITLDRIEGVLEAGADIASVVTDVTLNDDPEARTRAFIDRTRRFERSPA
ncbi:MAG: thiamine phosphate synthase [Pseudomonadota bacterium]